MAARWWALTTHFWTAAGLRLKPTMPPLVFVCRLLYALINRHLAEGGHCTALYTELTIAEFSVGCRVCVFQGCHLTPVETHVATVVHTIVSEHPRQHLPHG